METLSAEVLDDLRHDRAPRERKLAVCGAGGAHIPPTERVEILAVLSHDQDELVAEKAGEALLSTVPEHFVESLKRENALPALFSYAGKNLGTHATVVAALLANSNCAGEHIAPLVPVLSSSQVQLLMDELDRNIAADTGDYGHLHQIRISGKRLRYAMEIFADCFAPPFRDKMYPAIEAMQELLGSANDSHVAQQRLSDLRNPLKLTCPDDWARLRPGIERLLQSHRQRLTAERQRFRRWCQTWRKARLPLAGLLLPASEPAAESA